MNASGSSFQSGWRSGAVTRIATHTAAPMTGNCVEHVGKLEVGHHVGAIAATRMQRDDADARPVDACRGARVLHDRRVALLLERGRDAADDQRHRRGDVGIEHREGLTPSIHIIVVVVSPTTLPAPPALEAATMAAR